MQAEWALEAPFHEATDSRPLLEYVVILQPEKNRSEAKFVGCRLVFYYREEPLKSGSKGGLDVDSRTTPRQEP
jgi:hypothetical protein